MTTAATRPDTPAAIVVRLDVSQAGRYISAECQLGAHWGCPGGLWNEARVRELTCMCGTPECPCSRNLPGGSQ
ncbi:hypothetical protein [Streptomyces sp. 1331.2]|uniref:hypothetical protein n=1 Tax=Streptomyces sp. 1331.2 TaxID=1938835 RepID=UPI000BDCBA09|nr:hypothetical protein [Streptomyces sp. 1331.2]SOB84226.1 hypothetical protein SAMN06272789_4471 [Streptomyces sp. 1331.2]